jgi:hypothetical protein
MKWPLALAAAFITALAANASADEPVESPVYKSWARYKVGTSIRLQAVTLIQGNRVETTTTARLVELTDEKVVVESVTASDGTGKAIENAPQKLVYRRAFVLLPGVKREDVGKPDGSIARGEESLKLAGKEYKAQWFDSKSRVEAGEALTRTWMSDDVPGKLLKSVTKVPAADKTTTLELVEIKTP